MQHSVLLGGVLTSQFGVAPGMPTLILYSLGCQLTSGLGRNAHHHGVCRNILGHNRAGSNECPFSHANAVENNRTDSDQTTIPERGPVNHGSMANGHVHPDQYGLIGIAMQHRPVLNIAERTDSDPT